MAPSSMVDGMIMLSHMPECHMSTMEHSTSTMEMGMPTNRNAKRLPRK